MFNTSFPSLSWSKKVFYLSAEATVISSCLRNATERVYTYSQEFFEIYRSTRYHQNRQKKSPFNYENRLGSLPKTNKSDYQPITKVDSYYSEWLKTTKKRKISKSDYFAKSNFSFWKFRKKSALLRDKELWLVPLLGVLYLELVIVMANK